MRNRTIKTETLVHLERIQALKKKSHHWIHWQQLAVVTANGQDFPIEAVVIGPEDKTLPTFGLFAGVHGVEEIGTGLVLYHLESLLNRLDWDKGFQKRIEQCRLVAIPLINPGGMFDKTRSNPSGIDLMRNAPIDTDERPTWLVGGHRLSNRLPWYRGKVGARMEVESQALIDFVAAEMFSARFAMALDVHSGFGFRDRLWHPYAKTKHAFPYLRQAETLHTLLNKSHPHHVYIVEGQAQHYLTHGDLWDFIVDEHVKNKNSHAATFLPWTLEMGSWRWVRKNPKQLLQIFGLFNPVASHRYERVMRRHFYLLDFLFRATANFDSWMEGP